MKGCRAPFVDADKRRTWCDENCGLIVAQLRLAAIKAKAAKEERAEKKRADALHRARLAETMPLKKQLKLTEQVINGYVRVRDSLDGCISCNKPSHWDGQWHASHFKSVGSNSRLRYNLWNIHKSCSECNKFLSGNVAEYEKRLLLKFNRAGIDGAARINWLRCQNGVTDYTPEYLTRLRAVFAKKTRRALARLER